MIRLSFSHRYISEGSVLPGSALFLSIAVLLTWGIGGIFMKLSLNGIPLIAYLGLYPFILPPLTFTYLKHGKVAWKAFRLKWTVPVICAIMVAELWQIGYFGEAAAISQGYASIVFPIILAYPIVAIIGANLCLKECFSDTDWMFLLFVIIGIMLISI